MNIAFWGSSLVSAYWNGAATYYRGLIRALAHRGHEIVFYEPDAFDRQANRDIDDPDWAEVVVYDPDADLHPLLERTASADLVVQASGIGVLDDELSALLLRQRQENQRIIYWDVDAPATLASLEAGEKPALAEALPDFDGVLTYGGGPPVIKAYCSQGARFVRPIYNAVDPDTHHPVAAEPEFNCDLALLANRLPDREARIAEFFIQVAGNHPDQRFLLGGNGWSREDVPANTRLLGHVPPTRHNALNCSSRFVLNVSRHDMAATGFSPATRVFEAAGAGACLISDAWEGIDEFLEPGDEILVARDGEEVSRHIASVTPEEAAEIGHRARQRVLAEHTYQQRAVAVEQALKEMDKEAIACTS